MVNKNKNDRAYNIGVSREIEPLYIVAVQLNTLIPEGIATKNVRNENTIEANCDCPLTNMWCPQTRNPMMAIDTDDIAMALYPKIAFLQNVGMISLMIAIPGRIMIYTAGCE